MNLCWVCKGVNPDSPNFSGCCWKCRKRLGEGIQTVREDGTLNPVNKKGVWTVLNCARSYAGKRFADDTGFYHQFHSTPAR